MHYPIVDGLLGNVKGYIYALNNVNLEIYENEILGLVGESGSGKSTLGNCILKLIEPTSGEVVFANENILYKKKKDLKDFRKKLTNIVNNRQKLDDFWQNYNKPTTMEEHMKELYEYYEIKELK
jgi:ABC-type oligopeptide transport system ATPase subunit